MRTLCLLSLVVLVLAGCGERIDPPATTTITLFDNVTVHFTPDDSTRYDSPFASARDNGRIMSTYREFPAHTGPKTITARILVEPIRKDIRNVVDRWDRAGSVRLIRPGMAPVEMIRFMTAYGGVIEHEVDVSDLAPLLHGHCEFEVFIDTWVTPAWTVSLDLIMTPRNISLAPTSVTGLWLPKDGLVTDAPEVSENITIPADTKRIVMSSLVSGHCTDGRDADEFITKDNVILVDGIEVHRWRPWRDDCGEFRAVNPYCARWADGSWSSDYSRSNWCPGDVVDPHEVDLSKWLTAGDHVVTYRIENIRPEDESGHGYWRLASRLMIWE